MHLVIDKKRWQFLPIKHEAVHTVCDLLWISGQHIEALVVPLNQNFLHMLSDVEMMVLYKNTTGQTGPRVGDQMRCILFELAERIPVNDVVSFEAAQQAEKVPAKSKERFVYEKGGFVPKKVTSSWDFEAVKLPRADNESQIALRPRVGPQGPAVPVPRTPAPAGDINGATRASSGPRMGGARELVWAVADKLWEEAGKPSDVSVVLKLRKDMMNVLEAQHGVKRTTSSNELGAWMKSRI